MAGIVNASRDDQQVIGISSLKVPDTANNELINLMRLANRSQELQDIV